MSQSETSRCDLTDAELTVTRPFLRFHRRRSTLKLRCTSAQALLVILLIGLLRAGSMTRSGLPHVRFIETARRSERVFALLLPTAAFGEARQKFALDE